MSCNNEMQKRRKKMKLRERFHKYVENHRDEIALSLIAMNPDPGKYELLEKLRNY